ncbi:substrate-binding domain-containing protein [Arthrobacter sp. ISL-65]|uniref:substrate-binding domain-containing protein n=1 Tax=Arthrobacter sp. ISL-65 TaxID=2819112 RepID=UPI001BEB2E44|nr:substrate-binding domain-containing protein [Arthrobacter sp. ISL-65]MBT2550828.1 substrate-binding domain-containing protein [Arthrobacter sp. ISL-65]
MFRKIIAGSATLLAAISLTACGGTATTGNTTEAKDITIGLAVPNVVSPFFNQVRMSVEKEAAAKGIQVVVADANDNSEKQVAQVEDFVTKNVDAIIYVAAGATAATVPVRTAKAAGIPVVTVDRNPEGAPGDTFIATDSIASSTELGEWVVEQTKGKGVLGTIQGQIGTTPEIDRDKGFTNALSKAPGIKEVARQASQTWSQAEGFAIATDMLQAHPEITIFVAHADSLALGAAQAARSAGRDDILIVGHDGDPAGLEAIINGTLGATETQPSVGIATLAVDSALKLINKESVPEVQLQDGILTTKENAKEFIAKHP